MQKSRMRIVLAVARSLASVSKLAVIASLSIPPTVTVAYSRYDLPRPYVSRALDAVLVPINNASRLRYNIPRSMHGVYVLAVDPHGIAAHQGIRPGDVLSTVRDHPIYLPADVDSLVWAALAVSVTDFLFGVSRGGTIIDVNTNITVNNFNQTINVNNISNWTSIENEQDWTQFVDQYNTDISNSITDTSYEDTASDTTVQDVDSSSSSNSDEDSNTDVSDDNDDATTGDDDNTSDDADDGDDDSIDDGDDNTD